MTSQAFLKTLLSSAYDLVPIFLVIGFFQLAILQQPIPNLLEMLLGSLFVLLGLTFLSKVWRWGSFPLENPWPMPLPEKGL